MLTHATPLSPSLLHACRGGAQRRSVAGAGASHFQVVEARQTAVNAAATYIPPTTTEPLPNYTEAAFIGDSYGAGTGATSRAKRWSTLVAQEKGWVELNYSKGGTNYATADARRGGKPYHERLTDLLISQPDIVIVTSAGNSLGRDQSEGIDKTFQTLREELPDAQIYAVSPFRWAGDYPDDYREFGEDVKAGVENVGGEYLEIGHPLGDRPDAIYEDGTHPNNVGHALLADAIGDAMHQAGISVGS
ncbi:SGNH/GDSL hydrolase family protein [Kocuria sp. M1N1S27]|uniref:SGNH/GDSL hydrolase family protein n=1 Tax=Kocuria kalidii TaxID=3376283 RepID=UPI0037AFB3E2